MHKDPDCSLAESLFVSAGVNTTLNSGGCTSQTTAPYMHHPGRLHPGAGRALTTKRVQKSPNHAKVFFQVRLWQVQQVWMNASMLLYHFSLVLCVR